MTTGTTPTTVNTAITFSFPFFGTTRTHLWVCADGAISFSDGSPATPADPGGANGDLSRTPITTGPALAQTPLRPAIP